MFFKIKQRLYANVPKGAPQQVNRYARKSIKDYIDADHSLVSTKNLGPKQWIIGLEPRAG